MANDLRAAPRIPTQESATPPQIDALDGLRAVAALMVLTTHVAFHTGLVTKGALGAILSRLDLGVCIFFLLSGFLLYRPWARAAMGDTASPGTRRYLRKRFARVYPAYFVLVVFVLGLYPPVAPAPWDEWLAYLTLTHIYVPGIAVSELGQVWSLATEVAFYALLPAVGWIAGRRHRGDPDRSAARQMAVLAAMWVVALAFLLVRSWTELLPDWLSSFWLPGFLDWFAAGMLLAVVQARLAIGGQVPPPAAFLKLRAMAQDGTTSVVYAVLCFAIVATPVAGKYFFDGEFGPDKGGPWAIITKHYLFGATAFFLLLPLVLGSANHWYARFLSSPLMIRLGTVSYGIFLWHLLVLSAIAGALGIGVFQGGFWLLFPATILGTVAIASLSWRFLEKPVLAWAHSGRPARRRPMRRGPRTVPR